MKLTNAQVTRIEEALIHAQLIHQDTDIGWEPQRGRVEMLIDDIMEICGLARGDVAVTKEDTNG